MNKYEEIITRARISLLFRQPFWGTLATRLTLKDVTDEGWCSTLATDGRHFFYNRDFVAKLSKEEAIWCVGHEIFHVVYEHMDRRGGRLPKLFNAAADFVINLELGDQHIGKAPTMETTGIQILYDTRYRGMFVEQVYELLLKDPDANYPEFDVHLEPGDGKGGQQMSEEERRMLREEIRAAVMQAAKSSPGSVPAGIKRLLSELTEPQMDWRELISLKIQSTVKNDYTWARQSRKSIYSNIYLPGLKDDFKLDVAVAIDTSGSMSNEMLRDLVSEVAGIMSQFADFTLHLWCFDTQVYNYVKFTPDTFNDIYDYEVDGGGGTDFTVNWDFMREAEIQPERFLMMTDGYPNSAGWGTEDWCDTTFLIHSDSSQRIVAPFGTTAYYTGPTK